MFKLKNKPTITFQVDEQLLVKPTIPEMLAATAGVPPSGNILVSRKGGDLVLLDQLTGRYKSELWLVQTNPVSLPDLEGQAHTGDGVNYTFKLTISIQVQTEPSQLQKLLFTYQPLNKLWQTLEREMWLLFQNFYLADLEEQSDRLTTQAELLCKRKTAEMGLKIANFELKFNPSN